MNSVFPPLHSWQRIWLGHIPGTEEPPTSILLIVAARASPLWARQESDGKGATQNTIQTQRSRDLFWAGLRGQISHASAATGTPHLLQPPERASGAPAYQGRLPLYPKLCVHNPWPSVGHCGLRYPCSTTASGWAWSVTPPTWTFHVCGPR